MNIICIGAHPDDIEIGCAGTIKRFVNQGNKVYYLIATLGEKVSVDNAELLKIKDSRTKESINAAKYIGASDIFMLNLNDTRIKHDGETVKAIEKKINEINPDYIFTHTVDDNHQDHKNIALSTLSACRRRKCIFYIMNHHLQHSILYPQFILILLKLLIVKLTLLNFF